MRVSSSVVLSILGSSLVAAQAPENATQIVPLSLPDTEEEIVARQAEIATARAGFLYGPSPLGNVSYYPDGPLGDARVSQDVFAFFEEAGMYRPLLQLDAQKAIATARALGGLNELKDYLALYEGQWLYSNPDGINVGFLTNFTQDLYFSMERLSLNPYPLRRIKPSAELPFAIEDDVVTQITTQSLKALHEAGQLFVVDYSALESIPPTDGKYAAACTAYFYLHPETEEFLPLAIKAGAADDALVYTPLDSENDWFLAKTLFESNDNLYIAAYHLAATHATAEIIHIAAVRTLAPAHPVRGLLDRLMYRGYAIRTAGARTIFSPGAEFDRSFAHGTEGFSAYASILYHAEGGHVQSMYFDHFFAERGLLNCSYGPDLPIFPFFDDVAPMVSVINKFMTAFIAEYYENDAMVAEDQEIQAWAEEASGAAEIYDFPAAPITKRETLVKLLSHVAYMAGIQHHVLNTGSLATSRTLPLHPTAHWSPLPTSKGIDSVMPYLPNVNQSIAQIVFENTFNRPNLMYENGTLVNAFSDPGFLAKTTDGVKIAASEFLQSMAKLGTGIDGKKFDDQGLVQGMPFIWRDVSPLKMPFFLAI